MEINPVILFLGTNFLTFMTILFFTKFRKRRKDSRLEDYLLNERKVEYDKVNEKLRKHTKHFEKEVILVEDNVHVAVGFGLANCILIEGAISSVVIDTLETGEAAKDVLEAFEPILKKKPISAIILTHFHVDHSGGLSAFLDMYPEAEVYHHELFPILEKQETAQKAQATWKGAMFQFGCFIKERENCGIGKELRYTQNSKRIIPTADHVKLVKDCLDITVCGSVSLRLIHAPGETMDQLVIWYEDKKMLFPADNIYQAMPNLYALRGTRSRDPLTWVSALDLMVNLEAEILVPQHTRPVYGKEKIKELLISYRDAIQFIHDQTMKGIGKGLPPDDIAQGIKLPTSLGAHAHLQEFYGTVEWNSKAIYHHYMNQFNGKVTDLHLMTRLEKANLILKIGGEDYKATFERAEEDFKSGNLRAALNFCDALILGITPFRDKAKDLKSRILRRLGEREISSNGRNWYFSSALENDGFQFKPPRTTVKNLIYSMPIEYMMKALTVHLIPEKVGKKSELVHFYFKDVNEHFSLKLSNATLTVRQEAPNPETKITLQISCDAEVWRALVAKDINGLWAYLTGKISIHPHIFKFQTFVSYFDDI